MAPREIFSGKAKHLQARSFMLCATTCDIFNGFWGPISTLVMVADRGGSQGPQWTPIGVTPPYPQEKIVYITIIAIYPKCNPSFDPFRAKRVSFLFFVSKTIPMDLPLGVIREPKDMGLIAIFWPHYSP